MSNPADQALAVFDLDQTLVKGNSFTMFLWYYYANFAKSRYMPLLALAIVCRKLRLISLQKAKEMCLLGLQGMERDSIEELGRAFFDEVLKKRFHHKAIDRVLHHHSRKDLIYLATASPDIYIKPIIQWLQLDGYVATELMYHNNRYTGRLAGIDCLGQEKVHRLSEQLPAGLWEYSYAYSDNLSDEPLLRAVKYGMITLDTDKNKRQAHRFGWLVTDFSS